MGIRTNGFLCVKSNIYDIITGDLHFRGMHTVLNPGFITFAETDGIISEDTRFSECGQNYIQAFEIMSRGKQKMKEINNYDTGEYPLVRNLISEDSARLLKKIIENINGGVSVGVFSNDGSASLAYANDKYYELLGYTKEQLMSELKSPHDVILPEDMEYVSTIVQTVKKTRQAVTFRYRIKKRDGSVISICCSSSVASIEGLGENVFISVLTDITSEVNTEHKALIFGQRLNAIMSNINNGVVAYLLGENGTVDYAFSTDRYYEIFVFTREQYHKEVNDPFALIYSEDTGRVRKQILELKDVGDKASLRYRAVRRDGQMIWLDESITIMTFFDAERPVQLSVFTDVTQTIAANERLTAQHKQIVELLDSTPAESQL